MPVDHDGTHTLSLDSSSSDPSSGIGSLPGANLRKEVLSPAPHNTGVGVMLVASAAMFFAVASSAFILRAQQGQCHSQSSVVQSYTPQTITVDNQTDGIEVLSVEVIDANLGEGIEQCGAPIIQKGANNSTDIIFRVCTK
ncbi:MAG: hypothetical protein JKY56_00040 [Kofleriaceae bacterium]|nr:hypothetical protein [Kofleriaceae bacterium]